MKSAEHGHVRAELALPPKLICCVTGDWAPGLGAWTAVLPCALSSEIGGVFGKEGVRNPGDPHVIANCCVNTPG